MRWPALDCARGAHSRTVLESALLDRNEALAVEQL
jgi:hypothetical protein